MVENLNSHTINHNKLKINQNFNDHVCVFCVCVLGSKIYAVIFDIQNGIATISCDRRKYETLWYVEA